MTQAGDVPLSFLEKFVFSKSYGERKEEINHLTPGSTQFLYFSILNEQLENLKEKTPLETELITQLKKISNECFRMFDLRRNLISYDNLTETKKKSVIDFIRNDLLRLSYNDSPPFIGSSSISKSENYPTKLDSSIVNWESYLNKTEIQGSFISNLSEEGALQVASSIQDVSFIQRLFNKIPYISRIKNVIPLIIKYLSDNRSYSTLSINLSLEELEELGKKYPKIKSDEQYITQLIERYKPSSDINMEYESDEKKRYYEKIWELGISLDVINHGMKLSLMSIYLEYEWKNGRQNHSNFMKYLRLPQQNVYILRNKNNLKNNESSSANRSIFGQLNISIVDPTTLIEKYLFYFISLLFLSNQTTTTTSSSSSSSSSSSVNIKNIKESEEYREYEELVDNNKLIRIYLEAGILSGVMKSSDLSERIEDADFIKEITNRIEITLTDENKTVFHPEDDVTLSLHIKNVKKLYVNIYEINTFTYYSLEKKEIDMSIDLDGLIANEKMEFDYSKDFPSVRRTLNLPIPSLGKGRRGVFLVVFVGNGLTSRALIKKGTLRLITKNLAIGHVATVVDEGNRVEIDGSVWIDGKRYGRDTGASTRLRLAEGEFIIPYRSSNSIGKGEAIVVTQNNTFASLVRFQQLEEHYTFHAGIYIHREELIRFNTAHIIIHPILKCNGIIAPIGLIENPIITVVANNVDKIPTTQTFTGDEIKFSDNSETVLKFRIPEFIQSLNVTINCRVRNRVDDKAIDLSVNREFKINLIDSKSHIVDCSLKHTPHKGYILVITGKSGEPIRNHTIILSYHYCCLPDRDQPTIKLMSDEYGEIELGTLEDISDIKVVIESSGSDNSRTFFLEKYRDDEIIEGEKYIVRKGETIKIPFMGNTNHFKLVSLLQLINNNNEKGVKRDLTDALTLIPGCIIIDNKIELEGGDYLLYDFRTKRKVLIYVIEGRDTNKEKPPPPSPPPSLEKSPRSSETTSFLLNNTILGKRRIGIIGDNAIPFSIADVKITKDTKTGENENGWINVSVIGASRSCRVHAFASRYVPVFSAQALLSAITPRSESELLCYSEPTSYIASNKNLGTEQMYILNRKNQTEKMGNTLITPSILLNPVVNKSTQQQGDVNRPSERFEEKSGVGNTYSDSSSRNYGGYGGRGGSMFYFVSFLFFLYIF
jgi:hypothetical protein